MKQKSSSTGMRFAIAALMLSFGVASGYGQYRSVTGSFSGTGVPTTVVLQAGAFHGEYDLAGNGALGPFTFRAFTASAPAQAPSGSNCVIYGSVVAGGGVFRFQDGSLLMVNSGQGTDCITPPLAHCTRTFTISGGTGRFRDVSGGTLNFTFTVRPVLFDAGMNPAISAITDGELTGTVSGASLDQGSENRRP